MPVEEFSWRKIEHPESVPGLLDLPEDQCLYYMEYTIGAGFSGSRANQNISNFKKTADKRGTWEWPHKTRAIRQFAADLTKILKGDIEYSVCFVPSSKRNDDPLYDDRFESTLQLLEQSLPNVECVYPFEMTTTHQSSHTGGERSISSFYDKLEWANIDLQDRNVIIIDDVITSGSHFKACQKLIMENEPSANTFGLFWAKAIRQDAVDDFSDII